MKKLICLLLFCRAYLCFAQIDSLVQCLSSTKGKEKIELLNKLTILDSSQFRAYHQQAMQLALELNDSKCKVEALCAIGDHYYNIMETDSAFSYYTKALDIARKNKLEHEIIACLKNLALTMEDKALYDRELFFYMQALEESRKMNDQKEIMIALEQIGLFHTSQRNDSAALKYLNDQLMLAEELKDSSYIASGFSNIGLVYYRKGDYINSIQNYQKSLAIAKSIKDNNVVAKSLINIGIDYKDQAKYAFALDNLITATRYFEKGSTSYDLGACYTTIGNIFIELDSTDKALEYHKEALDIFQKINNKRGIAGSLTNIGNAYKKQGKYDSALVYLNRSLIIKKELGDKAMLASTLDLLGEVSLLQHNYVKAEDFFLQSMKLKQEVEDPKGKATTLNNLGSLYLQWEKYDQATTALDEARAIAHDIGAKSVLLNNYKITIDVYKAKNDYKQVAHYYDLYTTLNAELFNEQKTKALNELQIQYQTEKNEQKIELMSEQEKSQAAVVSKQLTLIVSLAIGGILLIIIVLISLKAYRSGKKANRQSLVIIEQKQTMLRELHHRVKNNMQVLSSLLNLQRQRLQDEPTKEAIKAVEHRLNAMLLIHQDLYGDKVDSQVNLAEYIKKLVDNLLFSFGYSAEEVKVNLSAETIFLDADKALSLGFICNEVVSNSFKHAFAKTNHPQLNILLKKENENIHLSVGDNGSGIMIDPEKTNSFGLRLIQMFITDLQGTINIVSDQQGSRFEFSIPANKTNK
jgi:two-component sensor histidine kinase